MDTNEHESQRAPCELLIAGTYVGKVYILTEWTAGPEHERGRAQGTLGRPDMAKFGLYVMAHNFILLSLGRTAGQTYTVRLGLLWRG
jgi:hypothetical protein